MLERLPELVSEAFLPHPPQVLGVAVSGGSDSMALLHLMHEFCQINKIELQAVTVDHRLRPEAAQEAAHVARQCAEMGLPHDTLIWQDWSGEGNLQNAARNARYHKMACWAGTRGIDTIAVGHTADDQAETVLMRLARRSGVDGLSAMQNRTHREGINWVRPLLRAKREVLRSYLNNRRITWFDDPSNEDDRYDRIKARNALAVLTPLGIDVEALGEVARNMTQARRALEWQTFLAARQMISIQVGAVVLDEILLRLQPDEVQRRLIIKAVNWVNGRTYTPRQSALASVMAALGESQAATLAGCHIRRIAAQIWVFREHKAVCDTETATDLFWDGRWKLTQSHPADNDPEYRVRALGHAGLEQCPDWRASGFPHVVLQSTPSIWKGDELVAAPLAGHPQNWQAELCEKEDTFFATLLSH